VYDLILVEVDEGVDNLGQVILYFYFSESLPALDEFIQRLVGAHLEQDVHVFVVFKDVFEFDHVLVAQRFVDFDLGDELGGSWVTFCLARERLSELFAMILAAETRFVSKLVTS
jgi:hypothetical protein